MSHASQISELYGAKSFTLEPSVDALWSAASPLSRHKYAFRHPFHRRFMDTATRRIHRGAVSSADHIRILCPQRHAAISALIKVPSAVPCCVRQGQSSPSAGFVSAAKSASIRIIRARRAHADRVMRGAQQRERVQHPATSCYVRLVAMTVNPVRTLAAVPRDPFGIRPHARMSAWTVYLGELLNDILPRVSCWNICGLAWPEQRQPCEEGG